MASPKKSGVVFRRRFFIFYCCQKKGGNALAKFIYYYACKKTIYSHLEVVKASDTKTLGGETARIVMQTLENMGDYHEKDILLLAPENISIVR
jgi:hypothetical protein